MWNNNTIEDEIQRNSLEYGIAVITDRALPDAKSGLKPVAKRILWDAIIEGRTHNKPHVKSARIVGDTMGRFHPHGDSSIYGTLIRLSQEWIMRYPLIDIHGNNGTILGDGAASMRYTEARLTKVAEEGLLQNLKKNVVDFDLNYDETEDEPITLPAIFPNLLCNPNEGIAWGMACSWAPHNLIEVSEAIHMVLEGKEPILPGPDFPTGGLIINGKDIPAIMKTGKGSVKIRAKYKIEKNKIIFYEMPYGVKVEDVMNKISALCNEEKLTGIKKIALDKVNLVVFCKDSPETVVSQLFKKTNLQTSFSYNQNALVDGVPTEMNLRDAIVVYINHNIECIVREAEFDKKKAEDRLEIVNGLLRALEDIDNIIALIKKSSSSADAIVKLQEKYSFTQNQAKAIVNMKLGSLSNLEKIELNKEKSDLSSKIEELNILITTPEKQKEELIKRLDDIVKKFGDKRRTEIVNLEIPKEEKEIATVIPVDCIINATSSTIKRVLASNIKVSRRGGKGVKLDNILLSSFKTNSVDRVCVFTNLGKMYSILADNIPENSETSYSDILKLNAGEKVVAVTSLKRSSAPEFVIIVTKNGYVKKSYLSDYSTNRSTGIAAINLSEGDSIANVLFMDKEDIVMISHNGMAIHIETSKINPVGRNTKGIKGMKFEVGDYVVSALPIHKTTDSLAIIGENGIGKKVNLTEFPLQGSNGKGVIINKTPVAGCAMVSDEDNIALLGERCLTISAKDIPLLSRTSQGNILIKGNINRIAKV